MNRTAKILFPVFFLAVSGFAQQPSSEHQADTPAAQPAPAEVLSLAKALAGTWSITARFGPNEPIPNVTSKNESSAGVARGQEVWRSGPGGFTLIDEEDIHAPFGEVFLVGILWWDNATKTLRGMECTNQNRHGCDLDGALHGVSLSWDGRQLVIDMHLVKNGKKMAWHEVWKDITANSFTQIGEMGEEGGPLERAVTIQGTKVADKPAQ